MTKPNLTRKDVAEFSVALLFGLVGVGVTSLAFFSNPVDPILLGFGCLLMYLGVVLTQNAAIAYYFDKIIEGK